MRDYSATPSDGGTCMPCCRVCVFAFTAFLVVAERTAREFCHAHARTQWKNGGRCWCARAGLFAVTRDFTGMCSARDGDGCWKIDFLTQMYCRFHAVICNNPSRLSLSLYELYSICKQHCTFSLSAVVKSSMCQKLQSHTHFPTFPTHLVNLPV